jgi:hypothetical protein
MNTSKPLKSFVKSRFPRVVAVYRDVRQVLRRPSLARVFSEIYRHECVARSGVSFRQRFYTSTDASHYVSPAGAAPTTARVNLQLPPVNFPKPEKVIVEDRDLGKCVGLWRVEDL